MEWKSAKGTKVICSVKRWARDNKGLLVSIDSVEYDNSRKIVAWSEKSIGKLKLNAVLLYYEGNTERGDKYDPSWISKIWCVYQLYAQRTR